MIVYEILAWFGDQEWSEGLFASEEAAEKRLASLREGEGGWNGIYPEHLEGYKDLIKAVVEPREVEE